MVGTTVCPLGNVPGSGMGLKVGQGAHMGLGLGGATVPIWEPGLDCWLALLVRA